MVLDNFPEVLAIAIELFKGETLRYTKKQQVAAAWLRVATKLQDVCHLV